uniref:Cdc23 domain-containing protein n=1 Tax=Trichobilharzia regenti TaxID=157069 RepID=A0AA85JFM5_TRIRE|nr:unnamed protein product [Trichobilharzia regenti]
MATWGPFTYNHSVIQMNESAEIVRYPISLCAVQADILQAFFECQLRGLRHSCKWLTDLLWSINLPIISAPDSVFSASNVHRSIPADKLTTFLLARSCFDIQEYDHCAEILSHNFEKSIHDYPKCFIDNYGYVYYFLYIYSRYMACEKRRANDAVESRLTLKPNEEAKSSFLSTARCNKELSSLKCEIEPYTSKMNYKDENKTHGIGNSFLLYANALICLRLGMKETTISLLVQAINFYPFLWPAWYELVDLIENKEEMNSLNLPTDDECWMRYFFEAKVYLKLHEGERALEILLKLSGSGFSKSFNLQAAIGLAYDELRAIELAKKQFKQLFNACPCRLDNVDVYSNILYVCEDLTDLAHLAHHCINLDRYNAETCCVVGNFFGLRGQHEKAVMYFRRALKLRTAYPLVWTLVGHEYMELRNTNAAIHAYKRALVYDRNDYRAWYGLGQMFEALGLPSFALYYYREAQYLVPTDSRLIVALGEIYEKLNRLDEAKKCYWRAYCVGDIEGGALIRLAACFEKCCEDAEAAAAYTEFIKLGHRYGVQKQSDLAAAYKHIANYHLRRGNYTDSVLAANRCLDYPETHEEAKAMLRQITVLAGDIEQLASSEPGNTDSQIERNKSGLDEEMGKITDAHISRKSGGSETSLKQNMKSTVSEIQPLSLSLSHALTSFNESTVLRRRFYLRKNMPLSSSPATSGATSLPVRPSHLAANISTDSIVADVDTNAGVGIDSINSIGSSVTEPVNTVTTSVHYSNSTLPCDTVSFDRTTSETMIDSVTTTGHGSYTPSMTNNRTSAAVTSINNQHNMQSNIMSFHEDESMRLSDEES